MDKYQNNLKKNEKENDDKYEDEDECKDRYKMNMYISSRLYIEFENLDTIDIYRI